MRLFASTLALITLWMSAPSAQALSCDDLIVEHLYFKEGAVIVRFKSGQGNTSSCPAAYQYASRSNHMQIVSALLSAQATGARVSMNYDGGQPLQNLLDTSVPNHWARHISLLGVSNQ